MSQSNRVVYNLDQNPSFTEAPVLTIGTFDGVHHGHQAVLNQAKSYGKPVVALTFTNHPSQVLKPQQHVEALTTPDYKHFLMLHAGVDLVVSLPFTHDLSQMTSEQFLRTLRQSIPFSHLILGHDAHIGRDREGDQEHIQKLANELNFTVEYVTPHLIDNLPVSSTRIRDHIRQGELEQAQELLGRPISYFGQIESGMGLGRTLGYPTLNLDVSHLCVPPLGVYLVVVLEGNMSYFGLANIGKAPTIRDDGRILLEVFLVDEPPTLPQGQIEVFLRKFMRPEQKFNSLEDLQAQIKRDIEQLK